MARTVRRDEIIGRRIDSFISVKFRIWDEDEICRIIGECGGVHTGFFVPALRLVKVGVPKELSPEELLARFKVRREVERATVPASISHAAQYHLATNDTLIDQQWHLKRVNAFHAWKYESGDPALKVGIIDTGIVSLGDLAGSVALGNSWDIELGIQSFDDPIQYCGECMPGDFASHGSMVLSIIRPNTNNNSDIAGVCYGCTIVFVVDQAEGNSLQAAAAIVKAVDLGAKVLNCSWGANGGYLDLQDAVDYAWNNDCVVVAAAHNFGEDLGQPGYNMYPAEFQHVLCVGATADINDTYPWFSNYGAPVDICAPGLNMLVCGYPNNDTPFGIRWIYGTSFSTPLVAGIAGLIRSANPLLTAQQTVDILLANVDAGRHANFSDYFPNAGVVNAAKSVLAALATVPANAGVVYPYLNFWGAGVSTTVTGGVATSNLSGAVNVEIGGYSSDPIVSVEMRVGGVLKYSGAPTTFQTTASDSGTPLPVQITVRTATGEVTESYDDIVVGVIAAGPVGGDAYLSGGGDVVVMGLAGFLGALAASLPVPLMVALGDTFLAVVGALSVPQITVSVAGNRGEQGTANLVLQPIGVSASGVRVDGATGAISISPVTVSAEGNVSLAGIVSLLTPTIGAQGAGIVGANGAVDAAIPPVVMSAVGDAADLGVILVAGTLSIPAIVVSATDDGMWFADMRLTVPTVQMSGQASHGVIGLVGISIPPLAMNGEAVATVFVQGAQSVPAIVVSATGDRGATGSGAIDLSNVSAAAIGEAFAPGEVHVIGAILIPASVVDASAETDPTAIGAILIPATIVSGILSIEVTPILESRWASEIVEGNQRRRVYKGPIRARAYEGPTRKRIYTVH